jgi:hypothetical protein
VKLKERKRPRKKESLDIREGKTTDRYLAPAKSKFAINVQTEEEREPTLMDPEERLGELRREIVA